MVLLTAVAVGVAAKYQSGNDGPKPPCFDTDGKTCIDLLPIEKAERAMLENPIATVTHFDGNPKVAAEYLRGRVADIVRANPWLGGWLHRDADDGLIRLWYDEKGIDTAPGLFREFSTDEIFLSLDMPHNAICLELKGKGAKVGRNCDIVGRNEPLWRVSLIPDKVRGKFLLVVSMSHTAGDGHTFYKIFRMLDGKAEIEALNPHRNFQFDEAAQQSMGQDGISYLPDEVDHPGFWTKIKREKAHNYIFTVSDQWLEDQKPSVPKRSAEDTTESDSQEAEKSDISINDIIVSWFFRITRTTVGLQISNLRGRLEGEGACSDLDAGNYHRPVPFTARDYRDPRLLRRSIVTTGGARRAGTDDDGNPTTLPDFSWENRHSVASNWRSLHGDGVLSLNGSASQGRHVPFYDANDIALTPAGVSALIIFAERPGVVGMHVVGSKEALAAVESSGIVKESIASF